MTDQEIARRATDRSFLEALLKDREIARRALDRLFSSKLIRVTAESLEVGVLEMIIAEAVAQGRREGERYGIDWARAAVTDLVNEMLSLPFPPENEEEAEE